MPETPDTNIIVGLGNPGPDYVGTRHNVGFVVIDRLAQDLGLEFTEKRGGSIAQTLISGRRLVLFKPASFVNTSGKPIKRLADEMSVLPEAIVIVHDDLDIDFAAVRVRSGGSSGGHRGLNSIIAALGTDAFARVKIGIGRPPGRMEPADFVLRRFNRTQEEEIEVSLTTAADAAKFIVTDNVSAAMNRYNRKINDKP